MMKPRTLSIIMIRTISFITYSPRTYDVIILDNIPKINPKTMKRKEFIRFKSSYTKSG